MGSDLALGYLQPLTSAAVFGFLAPVLLASVAGAVSTVVYASLAPSSEVALNSLVIGLHVCGHEVTGVLVRYKKIARAVMKQIHWPNTRCTLSATQAGHKHMRREICALSSTATTNWHQNCISVLGCNRLAANMWHSVQWLPPAKSHAICSWQPDCGRPACI